MSDRGAVMLAAAAWVGAVLVPVVSAWLVAGVVVAGLVWRRPVVWSVVLVLVVGTLTDRSLAGLDPPPDAAFEGVVTLVTDPEPTVVGGIQVEVSSPHGRLLAESRAPAVVDALAPLLAGERLRVVGETGALRRPSDWTRSRHLAGTLRLDSVAATGPGSPVASAANSHRRLLERGAASLEPTHRALLAGLVLGDDRAQPPELVADFRAAGLAHLTAVSGQNILFVLAIAGPALRRVRIWPRFVLAVAVIGAFALLTRFEPSVLRAAFVAGVALFAKTVGRPSGGVRHLSLAVVLLLAVDPLLVRSLGFRLSVAASLGVLVIGPRLASRLRGPRWFREGLAVTAGAQLAVAPVLVPVLGPMPLAAVPANVVAGPVAAALMVWGLTAGTVAGVVGGRLAAAVHVPSSVGLGVLETIADLGASLPLGSVDLRHVTLTVVAVLVAGLRPQLTVPAATVVSIALLAPILAPSTDGARAAGRNATLWVDGRVAVVDVDAGADPVDVLEAVREAHVVAIGLVVVRSPDTALADLVAALEARLRVGAVIGPVATGIDGIVEPADGFTVRVARIRVMVTDAGPPLTPRISWAVGDPDVTGAG